MGARGDESPSGSRPVTFRELRSLQRSILLEMDRLCRAEGLTYYLAYGTLLGAVRHGGFIPWDDDVDVMLPRKDYERLLDAFPAAAPAHLELGCSLTQPGWPLPYAKISDGRTDLTEPLEVPVVLGVNIDVFPVDALPAHALLRRVQSLELRFLRWALELRYIAPERGRDWHHPLAIAVAKPVLRLVPVAWLVRALTRSAMRGRGRPSRRVGVRVGSYDWSVPAAALDSPIELVFEGGRFLAPADPDAVLSVLYGDGYRRLPPVAERVSHHEFIARWRHPPA
ncbi:MAG TPA: LicD family protein [Nocardioidaceae bacterium]|nr:LicD family protein [Nocardioidaceae bacterium]